MNMPSFALLICTLVLQLFIAGALTFLLIRQRGINRELEALRTQFEESQIPWRERR